MSDHRKRVGPDLRAHRGADKPFSVACHKVDIILCGKLRRADQIPLIFPVRVICHHETTKPEDLRRPGHVFPLIAKPGGVLVRGGHTEATVDLMRLAGLKECGVCCEIMENDSTVWSLPHHRDLGGRALLHHDEMRGRYDQAGGYEEARACISFDCKRGWAFLHTPPLSHAFHESGNNPVSLCDGEHG